MESLVGLFETAARVKLLRLFVFNRQESFTPEEAMVRAKISAEEARTELTLLTAIGFLRRAGRLSKTAYHVDAHFEHLAPLEAFIRDTTSVRSAEILAKLRRAGALRLVLLSGFFTGAAESALDLLVVGDRLEEGPVAKIMAQIEAELGREIRYAVFSTEDFRYRIGVYDRLLRDVLDFPYRVLLDKVGL